MVWNWLPSLIVVNQVATKYSCNNDFPHSLEVPLGNIDEIDTKETHFNHGDNKGAFMTPEDTYEAIPGDPVPPPPRQKEKVVLPENTFNPYATTKNSSASKQSSPTYTMANPVYSEPTKRASPPKNVPASYQQPVLTEHGDGAYELDGVTCEENPSYAAGQASGEYMSPIPPSPSEATDVKET